MLEGAQGKGKDFSDESENQKYNASNDDIKGTQFPAVEGEGLQSQNEKFNENDAEESKEGSDDELAKLIEDQFKNKTTTAETLPQQETPVEQKPSTPTAILPDESNLDPSNEEGELKIDPSSLFEGLLTSVEPTTTPEQHPTPDAITTHSTQEKEEKEKAKDKAEETLTKANSAKKETKVIAEKGKHTKNPEKLVKKKTDAEEDQSFRVPEKPSKSHKTTPPKSDSKLLPKEKLSGGKPPSKGSVFKSASTKEKPTVRRSEPTSDPHLGKLAYLQQQVSHAVDYLSHSRPISWLVNFGSKKNEKKPSPSEVSTQKKEQHHEKKKKTHRA